MPCRSCAVHELVSDRTSTMDVRGCVARIFFDTPGDADAHELSARTARSTMNSVVRQAPRSTLAFLLNLAPVRQVQQPQPRKEHDAFCAAGAARGVAE